jgi:N-carbamoylputrescine amidase
MTHNTLIVALVQEKWDENPQNHQNNLAQGIQSAAQRGAQLVCLQELTLSPYFCTQADANAQPHMEDLHSGPTARFASKMAKENKVCITASLFEKEGYNTAVAFNAQGHLIGFTRKQHIPSGEKYHENHYFKPGNSNYPIHQVAGHPMGLPTCYDQWFPELSRIYGLKGAEVLIYPTAIGSEPTAPGL